MKPMKINRREPVNLYRKRQEEQPAHWPRPCTVVKYIALAATGIFLFKIGQAHAYAQRGYEAIGGEVFALLLPVFYWMVARIGRGMVEDVQNSDRRRRT